MTENLDPRTSYAAALDWADTVLHGIRPEQLGSPTPCEEFDVEGLARHLVATVRKITALAQGADPHALPFQIEPTGDLPGALAAARTAMEVVWAEPGVLERPLLVPWGTAPGRVALWGYVSEMLVHSWDLAVATGQPAEAPAGVAGPVLEIAKTLLPAERDEEFPFAAPVEPRAEACPTERLANWSGRHSSGARNHIAA